VEEDVWQQVEFTIIAGEHTIKINSSNSGYLKIDELEII